MTEPTFTPAAGRFAPTRFYDPVVALTRERLWRSLAVMYVAPRPGDVIADVGCGTGSLSVLLGRVEPRAQIIGLERTTLMRLAFRIVQLADGKEDTQPNADGVLPELLSDCGFGDVREAEV